MQCADIATSNTLHVNKLAGCVAFTQIITKKELYIKFYWWVSKEFMSKFSTEISSSYTKERKIWLYLACIQSATICRNRKPFESQRYFVNFDSLECFWWNVIFNCWCNHSAFLLSLATRCNFNINTHNISYFS